MEYRVRFSKSAVNDLNSIREYIYDNNKDAAVKEQPVQEYLTDSSGILGQIILEI